MKLPMALCLLLSCSSFTVNILGALTFDDVSSDLIYPPMAFSGVKLELASRSEVYIFQLF